ncbi:alpha/beta hydrolase [soil metagenome]
MLVLILVLGVAYLGVEAAQSRRRVTLPEVPGAWAVGRRTFSWTDAGRPDPLASGPARSRQVSVWMWYPARAGGGHPAPYAPGRWTDLHLPGPIGLGETSFDRIRVRSIAGATPAAGPHPLVVLAQGLGLAAVQYQALAETLASNGYVVAGYTPTSSASVTVVGGRVVHQSTAGSLPDAGLDTPSGRAAVTRLLRTWVADLRFVARRARSVAGNGLGLEVAPGVLLVGHSFGGAGALEACRRSPDCLGAVNLDGLDAGEVTRTGLSVPVLLLGHDGSCVTGDCVPRSAVDRNDRATARAMVAAGSGPAWSVTLAWTEHFDVTDYAAYRLALPLRRLLPLGPRDGRDSLRTTERCVLDLAAVATGVQERWGCLAGRLPGARSTHWPRGAR